MKEHDDNLKTSRTSASTQNNTASENVQTSNCHINLLNRKKPNILIRYKNNLGREASFNYKSSTQHYIEDNLNGIPQGIQLHCPVHCVSKVTVFDRIIDAEFTSEYSCHHGSHDHFERGFCGFGRVDQNAEDVAHFTKHRVGATNNILEADSHQPPVVAKTWFHTDAFPDKKEFLIILG